jgi:hypothetical protein
MLCVFGPGVELIHRRCAFMQGSTVLAQWVLIHTAAVACSFALVLLILLSGFALKRPDIHPWWVAHLARLLGSMAVVFMSAALCGIPLPYWSL